MTINVLSLFTVETAAKFLARGLEIAKLLGLPVSSWRSGDPTKSLFHYVADIEAAKDAKRGEFAKSGFLSTAEGDWATLHGLEVYGVTRGEATYAIPTATLTNGGGGVFELGVGDLVLKCTETGKTYRNTALGVDSGDVPQATFGAGMTLTYALIAEEAGAASSVGENDIDDFVTPGELGTFGVVIDSSTAAAAQDQQSLTELKDQCGDTLGALSPNGPPDAYEFVCKASHLTGVTEINRATAIGDSTTGEVTIYVAGTAGAVSGASVSAAQDAVMRWAAPLCHLPTVTSATEQSADLSVQILGADIPANYQELINGRLGALFIALEIGATVYRSRLIAEIHAAVPQAVSVILVTPAADVALDPHEVPVMGTVTIVEV